MMETGTSNLASVIEALSLSDIPGLLWEAKARHVTQLLGDEKYADAIGCAGSDEELQARL